MATADLAKLRGDVEKILDTFVQVAARLVQEDPTPDDIQQAQKLVAQFGGGASSADEPEVPTTADGFPVSAAARKAVRDAKAFARAFKDEDYAEKRLDAPGVWKDDMSAGKTEGIVKRQLGRHAPKSR